VMAGRVGAPRTVMITGAVWFSTQLQAVGRRRCGLLLWGMEIPGAVEE
jgi:hypothetical protein